MIPTNAALGFSGYTLNEIANEILNDDVEYTIEYTSKLPLEKVIKKSNLMIYQINLEMTKLNIEVMN